MNRILKASAALVVGMGMTFVASSANAATLKFRSSGIWSSANPTSVSGIGTNHIAWGRPARRWNGKPSRRSAYRFNGRGPKRVGISTLTSGPILLGKFTHFNYPIYSPFLTSATLDLNLQFDSTSKVFQVGFKHLETPNHAKVCAAGGGNPCRDKVSFGSNTSVETVRLAGKDYNLKLSGFSAKKGGPVIDHLFTHENRTNRAYLYGHLSEVEKVPEPATILASLTAAGAAGLINRKRKRNSNKTA